MPFFTCYQQRSRVQVCFVVAALTCVAQCFTAHSGDLHDGDAGAPSGSPAVLEVLPWPSEASEPLEHARMTEDLLAIQDVLITGSGKPVEGQLEALRSPEIQLSSQGRLVADQMNLQCLLVQPLLEVEELHDVLSGLSEKNAFQDEILWNLGLRLVLRQIADAATGLERGEVLKAGLRHLSGRTVPTRISEGVRVDLDRLRSSSATARSVREVSTEEYIMHAGIDYASLETLQHRRLAEAKEYLPVAGTSDDAWLTVALASVPGGDVLLALAIHDAAMSSRNLKAEERGFVGMKPDAAAASGWIETASGAPHPSRSADHDTDYRKIVHGLLVGPAVEGLDAAQRLLASSPPLRIFTAMDGMAALFVKASGDLREAGRPLRWHADRLRSDSVVNTTRQENLSSPIPADAELGLGAAHLLEESWRRAVASTRDHESSAEAFALQPVSTQRRVIANGLSRRLLTNLHGLTTHFWMKLTPSLPCSGAKPCSMNPRESCLRCSPYTTLGTIRLALL